MRHKCRPETIQPRNRYRSGGVQESCVFCLEESTEDEGHSTHEQRRHVKRDAKSGSSVEKDRLVGECHTGCQSGGVRSVDIRSDVRARRCRIGALYIDRSDECIKVA